jgi:hypothetical protein
MPDQTASPSPAETTAGDVSEGASVEQAVAYQPVPGGGGARIAPVLAPSSRRHRSGHGGKGGRSHSRSKSRKIRQLRWVVAVLVVLLMGMTMVAIYHWTKADALAAEALSLSIDLNNAQKELELLRTPARQ